MLRRFVLGIFCQRFLLWMNYGCTESLEKTLQDWVSIFCRLDIDSAIIWDIKWDVRYLLLAQRSTLYSIQSPSFIWPVLRSNISPIFLHLPHGFSDDQKVSRVLYVGQWVHD